MMNNPFVNFALKASGALFLAFFLHLGVLYTLNYPLFENHIVLSYVINLILVLKVFGILYLLRYKYKGQLGFLFLAGSIIKFAIFFIVFHPRFKADGVITKLEFASFFVPYLVGLILETVSLSKWLNKLDETSS